MKTSAIGSFSLYRPCENHAPISLLGAVRNGALAQVDRRKASHFETGPDVQLVNCGPWKPMRAHPIAGRAAQRGENELTAGPHQSGDVPHVLAPRLFVVSRGISTVMR